MRNSAYLDSYIRNITLRFHGVRPLLMLRAYFDDSGHPNDHQIVAVGGALSTYSKWEAFEDKWKTELIDAGAVKNGLPWFRMTEFESYEPPFNWERSKHERVLNNLIRIMHDHIDAYVADCFKADEGCGSVHEHFSRKDAQYNRSSPYFHNFFNVTSAVDLITSTFYRGETTQLVFADQDLTGDQAKLWYSEIKNERPDSFKHIESISFSPYAKTAQLHAADFVANTLTRQLKHFIQRDGHINYTYKRLLEKPHHFFLLGSNMWNGSWEGP